MRLDWLQHLTEQVGPFASVSMDATRTDASGDQEVALRARAHATRLREAGAPADVVEAVMDAVTSPTLRHGEVGRLVVANGSGVVLDLLLPERPVREQTLWGPVPQLLPAVRALSGSTSYLLAEVDSSGADLQVVGALGDHVDASTVEGEHDVLHKVPGGGWAHRRYQMRVEDSIERNADTVAEAIGSEVSRRGVDLVLLAGQDKPVASVLERLPGQAADRAVRLHSGGRAAGTDDQARDREVSEVLRRHDDDRRTEVLERFAGAQARQREAVQGLDSVVEVLQKGQVDTLLLRDDPSSDLRVWSTGRPEQLALRREDLEAMGADGAEQVRADAALVWALVGTGAAITLVGEERGWEEDLHPNASPDPDAEAAGDAPAQRFEGPVGGVGALLRWVDDSTPHDSAPSMPGHGTGIRHQGPDT